MSTITAPFTDEQVAALNATQTAECRDCVHMEEFFPDGLQCVWLQRELIQRQGAIIRDEDCPLTTPEASTPFTWGMLNREK